MVRLASLNVSSALNSRQKQNLFSYHPMLYRKSIMPQLKKELDKMEQEGIVRACPETTELVHNLVAVVKIGWNPPFVP